MEAMPKGMEKTMAVRDVQSTNDMAMQRRDSIRINFPELKKEDFANNEAYTEALSEQYRRLRTEEYELEVNRQCLEMFTASSSVAKINRDIWLKSLDKTAEADSCVVNAYKRQPILNPNSNAPYVKNGGIASCAKTAVAVVAQVSDNLGYTGSDNFTTKTGKGGSLASAKGVHDCIGNEEYRKTGRLCDLVKSGEIGAGAIVSVPSPNNGGSGYHAMVLADVRRDEKGNVQGYYLQGNNKTSYSYVDINDTKGNNVKQVICTATNEWMNNRVSDELAGKTPEELQTMIADTKGRIVNEGGSIDNLQKVEVDMMRLYTHVDQVTKFCDNYEEDLNALRRANAHKSLQTDVVLDKDKISILSENDMPKAVPDGLDNLFKPKEPVSEVKEARETQTEKNKNADFAANNVEADKKYVFDDIKCEDEWYDLIQDYLTSYNKNPNLPEALLADAKGLNGGEVKFVIDNLREMGNNEVLPDLLAENSGFSNDGKLPTIEDLLVKYSEKYSENDEKSTKDVFKGDREKYEACLNGLLAFLDGDTNSNDGADEFSSLLFAGMFADKGKPDEENKSSGKSTINPLDLIKYQNMRGRA